MRHSILEGASKQFREAKGYLSKIAAVAVDQEVIQQHIVNVVIRTTTTT
jgi:hypothetical protein